MLDGNKKSKSKSKINKVDKNKNYFTNIINKYYKELNKLSNDIDQYEKTIFLNFAELFDKYNIINIITKNTTDKLFTYLQNEIIENNESNFIYLKTDINGNVIPECNLQYQEFINFLNNIEIRKFIIDLQKKENEINKPAIYTDILNKGDVDEVKTLKIQYEPKQKSTNKIIVIPYSSIIENKNEYITKCPCCLKELFFNLADCTLIEVDNNE